jgi:hypothetical protein
MGVLGCRKWKDSFGLQQPWKYHGIEHIMDCYFSQSGLLTFIVQLLEVAIWPWQHNGTARDELYSF